MTTKQVYGTTLTSFLQSSDHVKVFFILLFSWKVNNIWYIFSLWWSVNKSDYTVVKKIACAVIIENKYPIIISFFLNELDVKKGKQTCTCFYGNHGHYLNFHCYQFKSWHLVIESVIWKSLWPKENFKILAWYEMHLICKMFYFCFHGNHSHNLRWTVYLVVSLVISYVKKIISVNTF
jgi:hypothetical protein